jgi:hypothetical protein
MSVMNYSDRANVVLARAAIEADKDQSPQIGSQHFLLALIDSGGLAGQILVHLNLTRERVQTAMEEVLARKAATPPQKTLVHSTRRHEAS